MLGCPLDPSNSDKHHLFCRWCLLVHLLTTGKGDNPRYMKILSHKIVEGEQHGSQVSNKKSMHHIGPVSKYLHTCNVAIRVLYINVLSESSKCLHTYDVKLSAFIHPDKYCPSNSPDQSLSEVLKWLQIQKIVRNKERQVFELSPTYYPKYKMFRNLHAL